MKKTAPILILESSAILFEGLAQILTRGGLEQPIRQALSLAEVGKIIAVRPGCVVILNPALVQHNAREFGALKNLGEETRWIAFVYLHFDPEFLSQFDGIIRISDAPGTVAQVIRQAMAGGTSREPKSGGDLLSEREIEVLRLLTTGASHKEIADRLHISVNTVITHRKNLSLKTGIKSLPGLTIFAVVNRHIPPDAIR